MQTNIREFEKAAEKFKAELNNITSDFKTKQATLKTKEDRKPLVTKEVAELENQLREKKDELRSLEREIPVLKEQLRKDEREITMKQTELQKVARDQAESLRQSGINTPKL